MSKYQLTVRYQILNPNINAEELFKRATAGSAALDLRCFPEKEVVLDCNQCELLPTGIAIHIDDANVMGLILPRSGLGHRGLVLGNTAGVIDSDYQGEILLSCWNRGNMPVTIKPKERIAQLVFIPIMHPTLIQVESFKTSGRAKACFGHSGTN